MIKTYLGEEYKNLLIQDIICHGVPSPKVWNKYLVKANIIRRLLNKVIDK